MVSDNRNVRRLTGKYTVTQFSEWKRALLLFDKVYAPPGVLDQLPTAVRELTFSIPYDPIDLPGVPGEWAERAVLNGLFGPREKDLRKNIDFLDSLVSSGGDFRGVANRVVAQACQELGIDAMPSYSSEEHFALDFREGDYCTYQAALNNLPVLDGDQVSWDAILEFRQDRSALKKYRDLRLWLSDGLKAKSVDQATDLIAQRIDDYEWSLQKHGLKSIMGALSQVLDAKWFAALAGGAGLAGLIAGPVGSAISAGLVASARVSVWIAERAVEREDVKRGKGSEIAVLYDARRKFK